MASGKSAVSRRLHTVTSRPLLSLDQQVVEIAGATIPEIFSERGEAAFRVLEAETLGGLDETRPFLLDTGGGLVESAAAVDLLRERGVVIWLDAPWEAVRSRLKDSEQSSRPLIARLGWPGLEELYARRRRLYAGAADFRLRTDQLTVASVASQAMLHSLQWERRYEGGVRP